MPTDTCSSDCTAEHRVVCRCLGVTEPTVVAAVSTCRDLKELRQETGAGTGCNACHRLLARYLNRQSSSSFVAPICSVK